MAKREAEAENHWPGFVDVLSTIVMVVTFLLIILGIVIFVISKNISTELAKSAQEIEAAQKKMDRAKRRSDMAARMLKAGAKIQAHLQAQVLEQEKAAARLMAKAKALAQSQSQSQSQSQKNTASSKNSAAVFRAQMSEELTQNDEIDSKDKLTVRTRETKNTRQIVISTTEQETDKRKLKVTSSSVALSLLFKGGVKITKDATGEIQTYLKSNKELEKARKYEIRAFFTTSIGSISEAKRLAYYRALATRNQLLMLGIEAKKIAIKVAASGRGEDAGKVNIYLK